MNSLVFEARKLGRRHIELSPFAAEPSRILWPQGETYEITPETYFSQLRLKDKQNITHLLSPFAQELERQKTPCAILAVGSSTFPQNYWDQLRQEQNIADPTVLQYSDIDLVVVPQNARRVDLLEKRVQEVLQRLKNNGMSQIAQISRGGSSDGNRLETNDGELHLEKTREYGLNCIHLIMGKISRSMQKIFDNPYAHPLSQKNREQITSIDIILRGEDSEGYFSGEAVNQMNAAQKIARERQENRPFCVLYTPTTA